MTDYGRKNHLATDLETAADVVAARCATLMKESPRREWKKIFEAEAFGRDTKFCADVRHFTKQRLKKLGVIK